MKRQTLFLVLGLVAVPAAAGEGPEQMAAYVILNFDITNVEGYQSYLGVVGPMIAGHGGEVLVAGPGSEVVEGNLGAMTVVLKFPSMGALRGWYDSPEYQEIRSLRTDNTEGGLVFAKGFVRPQQ